MSVDDCQNYIADVFSIFRAMAAQANAEHVAHSDPVALAKKTTLVTVLAIMQMEAKTFEVDLDAVGMANFDPLVDELDPNKNPTKKR